MADIIFKYQEMRNAASSIRTVATQYTAAAGDFQKDFIAAIKGWEGESRDKMVKFITGPVDEYLSSSIPQLLNALADLLDSNADEMESADSQVAENIPSSLG